MVQLLVLSRSIFMVRSSNTTHSVDVLQLRAMIRSSIMVLLQSFDSLALSGSPHGFVWLVPSQCGTLRHNDSFIKYGSLVANDSFLQHGSLIEQNSIV
jgi:hypothetical protein